VNDQQAYLLHAVDAVDAILDYTSEGRDAFFKDRKTQDAVIRNLEVIGQAVKGLSEETRALDPEVQWRQIAGMRDKLIHEYFGVDLALVWDAVERDLPGLGHGWKRSFRAWPRTNLIRAPATPRLALPPNPDSLARASNFPTGQNHSANRLRRRGSDRDGRRAAGDSCHGIALARHRRPGSSGCRLPDCAWADHPRSDCNRQ